MSEQKPEQTTTRIGFEAALDNFNADWRVVLTEEQVNMLRLFYQSAMRDLSLFIGAVNQANAQMIQAFQFMDSNAVNTKIEVPEVVVEQVATPVVKKAKKTTSRRNVK